MSKKALFRTDVAMINQYSAYNDGEGVISYTPIMWTKGNLQPYKQGFTIDQTEAGYRYNDWRVLYIKQLPPFDTSAILEGATLTKTYIYYDGAWYYAQSTQDWSIQARGVKHFKLIVEKTLAPEGIATPTPFNNLVEDFENAINELEQASTLINEVI